MDILGIADWDRECQEGVSTKFGAMRALYPPSCSTTRGTCMKAGSYPGHDQATSMGCYAQPIPNLNETP